MLTDAHSSCTTVGFDGYTCGGCGTTYPSHYWLRESAEGAVRCLECAPTAWEPVSVEAPDEDDAAAPEAAGSPGGERWILRGLAWSLWAVLSARLLTLADGKVGEPFVWLLDPGRVPPFWLLILLIWAPVLAAIGVATKRRWRRRTERRSREAALQRERRREEPVGGSYSRAPTATRGLPHRTQV
jgi:hypothetical protein